MSEPFLSEIRIMSFDFAPMGWASCNGQLMPINQNQSLFSLLGTTFGGNGQTNFSLPDFRDRVPIHVGSGHTLGERGGEAAHTLSIAELPTHTHVVTASNDNADNPIPTGAVLAAANNLYTAAAALTSIAPNTLASVGGSQPHLNMQPFLSLNFCIALQGIFPTPS